MALFVFILLWEEDQNKNKKYYLRKREYLFKKKNQIDGEKCSYGNQ